ncbi:hypothetical protein EJ06DRAFT_525762 [Trichodelitschia bisporula]|uniref:Uncharacterized protein n=1 Tax=Trichodelitschia bisporula TaxID=703511 RepID=A0A6G1IAK9_9PEZI|nr:hypothetical protein EJ06DRAFT_525762 [Trichodelitschia bisporula]
MRRCSVDTYIRTLRGNSTAQVTPHTTSRLLRRERKLTEHHELRRLLRVRGRESNMGAKVEGTVGGCVMAMELRTFDLSELVSRRRQDWINQVHVFHPLMDICDMYASVKVELGKVDLMELFDKLTSSTRCYPNKSRDRISTAGPRLAVKEYERIRPTILLPIPPEKEPSAVGV